MSHLGLIYDFYKDNLLVFVENEVESLRIYKSGSIIKFTSSKWIFLIFFLLFIDALNYEIVGKGNLETLYILNENGNCLAYKENGNSHILNETQISFLLKSNFKRSN